MRIEKCRNGFTLLEILVAMAILSVTVTAMMMSFRGGTASWSVGDARAQRNQSARGALEMMTRDLMNIFTKATTVYQIEGYHNTWIDDSTTRAWDTIYFTAASNYPSDTGGDCSDICEVGYKLVTSARALYRLEKNEVDVDLTDGTPSLLSPHVVGLNIEYYNGANWVDDYGPSTHPAAVRITISVEDEFQRESTEDFKTIIKLP